MVRFLALAAVCIVSAASAAAKNFPENGRFKPPPSEPEFIALPKM